ncbi:MAG: transposase family protein [Bacilli bacterium]|nr:transposase family protein [Bacilli bacterium]
MKSLTDSRQQIKCTYKIWDVVVCVIISALCGKKDWEEIHDFVEEKYSFFSSFLKMTGGIPCAKTYEGIMSIINYKELEKIVLSFFKTITKDVYSKIEILKF